MNKILLGALLAILIFVNCSPKARAQEAGKSLEGTPEILATILQAAQMGQQDIVRQYQSDIIIVPVAFSCLGWDVGRYLTVNEIERFQDKTFLEAAVFLAGSEGGLETGDIYLALSPMEVTAVKMPAGQNIAWAKLPLKLETGLIKNNLIFTLAGPFTLESKPFSKTTVSQDYWLEKMKNILSLFGFAAETYFVDYQKYPETLEELKSFLGELSIPLPCTDQVHYELEANPGDSSSLPVFEMTSPDGHLRLRYAAGDLKVVPAGGSSKQPSPTTPTTVE